MDRRQIASPVESGVEEVRVVGFDATPGFLVDPRWVAGDGGGGDGPNSLCDGRFRFT